MDYHGRTSEGASLASELLGLYELFKMGGLTADEFASAKQSVIRRFDRKAAAPLAPSHAPSPAAVEDDPLAVRAVGEIGLHHLTYEGCVELANQAVEDMMRALGHTVSPRSARPTSPRSVPRTDLSPPASPDRCSASSPLFFRRVPLGPHQSELSHISAPLPPPTPARPLEVPPPPSRLPAPSPPQPPAPAPPPPPVAHHTSTVAKRETSLCSRSPTPSTPPALLPSPVIAAEAAPAAERYDPLVGLAWDRLLCRGVEISSEDREAVCTSNDLGHVMIGTLPIKITPECRVKWSVVLTVKSTSSRDVLVGLTGRGRGTAGSIAFVLRGDGCVVGELGADNHIGSRYAPPLGPPKGKIISTTWVCCRVDGRSRTIGFSVDGRDYGVAFRLSRDMDSLLYPMVVLREEGEAALLPREKAS